MKNINVKEQFVGEVILSSKPVFVDFWATWCPPCLAFGPIFEEYATLSSEYECVKINVDELKEVATEYEIKSIPSILLFYKGKVVNKAIGVQSIDSLNNMLKEIKG